jgi:amino acid adenylation domain-containing protein
MEEKTAAIQNDISTRRARLSPAKRALLEKRMRGELKDLTKVQAIPRRPPQVPTNLSFAQQRLWVLSLLAPDNPFYNIPTAIRLKGPLNVAALKQSLNEVVRRHEALRTTFATVDGQPMQVIAPTLTIDLSLVDLQQIADTEREAEAQRLATQEAQLAFNLTQGPLVRLTLLQLDREDHVMLLTMHHIVSDEWSIDLFWREMEVLYEAFSTGAPSPLPELPIQYADFAHWQRQWLQGEVYQKQLSYWREQLGGDLPTLTLPTDRPRPAIQAFRGAKQSLTIPKVISESLKVLSRQEGVTLFMTLLAAFKTLLYRYTGQEDILVGSPVANRNRTEIEGLIGFFVNTLVLRTNLADNPSFRELLGRVREMALGAYSHQDLPFEKLVEELQPERSLGYNPLFQAMFVLQDASTSVPEFPNLTASVMEVESSTSHFDLTLSMRETEQGLAALLEYNTDLFDAVTMTRMLGHLQTLLEGIIANPDLSLSHLPLLTEAERHQLLVEWNDTQADYPQDLCAHQLFEAHAERTPEALAVVFASTAARHEEEQRLTYAELNRRANQLAHYLQTLGVGPEVCVGLCLERSPEMIVGLLGILKSGGAYVPLDPEYPEERLAFMMEDSQVPVLLTQQRLVDSLPANGARLVCLDTDWPVIARSNAENPVSGATSENLAYIIYTSGSTGTPKGVLLQHRGLVNFATAYVDILEVGPDSRWLQFSSISFDASLAEIFTALTAGGTLHLAARATLLSPVDLLDLLRRHAITAAILPPAMLAVLPATDLPQLQTLISAGEACSPQIVADWAPGRRFYNGYGPTEATIGPTLYRIKSGDERAENIPIGRPLANYQAYVLDPFLQSTPIGVPGELYLGGVGLARGYLNRPTLTAERFIPHPFSDTTDARLYRTGDLTCYRSDGNIEFLGRIDHQVKIRGFRIELGEIETVLNQHPAMKEAVVIAREDTPGDKRLVAYIVPDSVHAATISELRSFLKEKLPDYMVPSAFVKLDVFPLTPNGKVDRRALPKPDETRSELDEGYVAPRNEIETELVEIWEALLETRPIGVKDDFFDLGGHSLLAAQLAAQIERVFATNLPLVTLFQNPTIEELAGVLDRQSGSTTWSTLVALQVEGSRPPFFCAHPLCGDVVGFGIWTPYLGPDQPFYGLRARGLDGVQEPMTQIEAMAADYIEGIRAVQPEGPYYLGGYGSGSIIAFEMAQQLQAQGQEVGLLVIMNASPDQDYYNFTWGPRFVLDFLKNLPYWLNERLRLELARVVYHLQLQLRPTKTLGRLLQKVKLPKMLQIAKERFEERGRQLINEHNLALLDHEGVPRDFDILQRRIAETQWQAVKNYVPQVYSGRITVFRTSRQPLFCSFDPELGWGKFAAGGLEVKKITGSTPGILKEPHARVLAEQLKACLDEAQAHA